MKNNINLYITVMVYVNVSQNNNVLEIIIWNNMLNNKCRIRIYFLIRTNMRNSIL